MAEDFQAGICGGTWWNNSRSVLVGGGLSPCSMVNTSDHLGMINYGSSCKEFNNYYGNNFASSSAATDRTSIFCENPQKPQLLQSDSDSGGNSILTDWSQPLMNGNGHQESSNYNSMIQENMNLGLITSTTSGEDSTIISAYKAANQDNGSTTTHEGFSMESQMSLIQSLFEDSPSPSQQEQQQIQDSIFNHSQTMNYSYGGNNNLNESLFPAFWSKEDTLFHKPSLSNQHQHDQQPCGFHFSNNTPYWNASTSTTGTTTTSPSNDVIRASLLPSLQPHQLLVSCFDEKPSCQNLVSTKTINEEIRNSGSIKRENEPAFKRARIETPSPLPTFKVRKEKLGDRITALQQLVSPFGKTDTASVLHEAIEYVKFLHDQVNALSTPYLKNGNHIQHQQVGEHFLKEQEGPKQDLRGRGLCLVPISSTFPVATETTSDFWTPTFGATFR